jgi:hypothetical protein
MSTKFLFNPFTGNFDAATDVTVTPVGSAPNANGLTIGADGSTITLQPADATHPGVLTAANFNIFNNKQNALVIGNLTTAGGGSSYTLFVDALTTASPVPSAGFNTGPLTTASYQGNNFTLASPINLGEVQIIGGAPAGVPTGNVFIDIYASSANLPTGGVLATSDSILASSITLNNPTNFTFVTANFPALAAGNYIFIARGTTSDTTNAAKIRSTGNPPAMFGYAVSSNDGGATFSSVNYSNYYQIYSEIPVASPDGLTIGNGIGSVIGTGTTVSQHVADSTHNGYLSLTDWNIFNNKQPALGFTPENVANKGQPNGYAPLDGSGKVPYANLPAALMTFKGAWNPTTNTPTLTNGVGLNGDVYRASVGGTSSGPIVDTWFAGDFIIYNGTIWQRSPLADGVISVNGMAGSVTVNAINQLTGDVTAGPASGSQSVAATLATVNGNIGTFGTATQVATLTVNAKGLVTAVSNTSIQITESQVTNLVTDLAGKQATGNYITNLTGDATATGPGSVPITLATVNANVGSFGSSTSIPSFTVNAKGLITAASENPVIAPAGTLSGTTLNPTVVSSSLTSVGTITSGTWNGTNIAIANGGTGQSTKSTAFDALSPLTTKGDILGYSTTNDRVPVGTDGQLLTADSTQTLGVKWNSFGSLGIKPTIQTFTSGSGTYTTPVGVAYIKVKMVGGGGGGAGATTTYIGNAGAGGTTNFAGLLVANGGAGGTSTAANGGVGGTASITLPAYGTPLQGGYGNGAIFNGSGSGSANGGMGGTNPFGGAGSSSGYFSNGSAGVANTGAGGGGGGYQQGSPNAYGGPGGGAGGYIDAILPNPSTSPYSFVVGAAGSGQVGAGVGGAGGSGGSGYIEITEYYNNVSIGTTTAVTAIQPQITTYATGSGTFTTPTGALYLKVRMVGGGGGGSGSGQASGGTGGIGGNTTFGTSLLVANGGTGAAWASSVGSGGSASLGTGPIGTILTGGNGSGSSEATSTSQSSGGNGGTNPFGGAGTSTFGGTPGGPGVPNTGAGGAGAGTGITAADYPGFGGGAGGFVDAIINSPIATYSYSTALGGAGGTAGTSGFAGGDGGSGYIEVTAYFSNFSVGTSASVLANTVLAGPSSGANAGPTFRNLVQADLPAAVAAQYYCSVSTSITSGNPINFDTPSFDTNLAVTIGASWKFTVPAGLDGIYNISVNAETSSGTPDIVLYKNGTGVIRIVVASAINTEVSGSTLIKLVVGDFVDLRPDTNSTFFGPSGSLQLSTISINLVR